MAIHFGKLWRWFDGAPTHAEKTTMPKLGEYLTVKEAAEYLGVAKNTMRNWEADRKIPVHRHPVNNYRLYKISDLDELLRKAEQSVQPPLPRKRNKKAK